MALLKSTNVIGNLSATGNIIASKFILNGGNNNNLLLAGGNTKLISDFATAEQMAAANTSITNLSNGKVSKAGDTMTGVLTLGAYTNQSTKVTGGIKIHDLRSITPSPGMFGEKRVNYYFFQADGSRWSSIMHMHGWTVGDYASWEIAGNSHTDSTAVGTFKYRAGKNGTWSNWHSVILKDDYTGRLAQKLYFNDTSMAECTTSTKGLDYVCGITAFASGGELQWKSIDSLHVGYASTATKAIQDGDGNVIKDTYLKLAGGSLTGKLTANQGLEWTDVDWVPSGNINCKPTAHNNEWSFDIHDKTYINAMWHVWSAQSQTSILQCIAAPEYKVNIPHGKLGLGSANFQYNTADKCIDVLFT